MPFLPAGNKWCVELKRKNYKLNRREIIKGLFGLSALMVTGLKLPGMPGEPDSVPAEDSGPSALVSVGNKFTPARKSLDFAQIHLIGPWSG
jgi:hypothetical protein